MTFRQAILAEHDANGLRRNLDAGFVYRAAIVDGVLAGFIGVRGGTHVYHLFVDATYHRRGIARALWLAARAAALAGGAGAGHAGIFTVNASNVSVPFYASLGFERTAPMQVSRVCYDPMRLAAVPSASGAAGADFVGAA